MAVILILQNITQIHEYIQKIVHMVKDPALLTYLINA